MRAARQLNSSICATWTSSWLYLVHDQQKLWGLSQIWGCRPCRALSTQGSPIGIDFHGCVGSGKDESWDKAQRRAIWVAGCEALRGPRLGQSGVVSTLRIWSFQSLLKPLLQPLETSQRLAPVVYSHLGISYSCSLRPIWDTITGVPLYLPRCLILLGLGCFRICGSFLRATTPPGLKVQCPGIRVSVWLNRDEGSRKV